MEWSSVSLTWHKTPSQLTPNSLVSLWYRLLPTHHAPSTPATPVLHPAFPMPPLPCPFPLDCPSQAAPSPGSALRSQTKSPPVWCFFYSPPTPLHGAQNAEQGLRAKYCQSSTTSVNCLLNYYLTGCLSCWRQFCPLFAFLICRGTFLTKLDCSFETKSQQIYFQTKLKQEVRIQSVLYCDKSHITKPKCP